MNHLGVNRTLGRFLDVLVNTSHGSFYWVGCAIQQAGERRVSAVNRRTPVSRDCD
jgi:hypothetical protein